MSKAAALRAGATEAELAKDKKADFSGFGGAKRPARRHVFAEVAVGEDVLHNFPVDVMMTVLPVDRADMILGIDYLRHHHIWLSYSTNALYIDSGEPARKQSATR